MKQIDKLSFQLEEVSKTNSRNEKKEILVKYKDDSDFLEVLKFLNDTLVVTGIATKKVNKKLTEVENNFESILDLLNYVSINNTGSDEVVAKVQAFVRDNKQHEKMIKQLVTKTYKTGLSAKTLNDVYGKGFIPVVNLQLAETYKENSKKFPNDELFFVTIKYDGHRNFYHPVKKKFFTRSGKTQEGLTGLMKQIEEFHSNLKSQFGKDFVIDGELLIQETDKPKTEWFNETTKLLSAKQDNKTNIKFIIFDIIPVDEFENDGVSKDIYHERRAKLQTGFNYNGMNYDDKPFPLLEMSYILYFGKDKNKIMESYESAVNDDEEGIMINLNQPYFCKRTHTLLKVKPIQSADLEVVGFEEGTGKNEGLLGAIVVDYKGVNVRVGSGLTDELRKEIWENKEDYLGKIAEITYTTESTNQNNSDIKLRFPRFKTFRMDKTIDDINIE